MMPRVSLLRAPGLSAVGHGFTTRLGGVSPAPRDSLHLARRDGDASADIVENWSRVAREGGFDVEDLVLVDQVHAAAVLAAVAGTGPLSTLGAADGVVTAEPGLALAIRTADCVPVLLSAPGGVGAAHAGWRGVAAGVVGTTVARLAALVRCRPADMVAVIGPCAGVDAYETGSAVPDALVRAGLPRERIVKPGPGGREHTDLRGAVRLQLQAAGVVRIEDVNVCTMSDRRMFSHRRDGAATGRQASFIVCPA